MRGTRARPDSAANCEEDVRRAQPAAAPLRADESPLPDPARDEPGDDDVMRKVLGDLTAKGVDVAEGDVRQQMDTLLDTAKQQLLNES